MQPLSPSATWLVSIDAAATVYVLIASCPKPKIHYCLLSMCRRMYAVAAAYKLIRQVSNVLQSDIRAGSMIAGG